MQRAVCFRAKHSVFYCILIFFYILLFSCEIMPNYVNFKRHSLNFISLTLTLVLEFQLKKDPKINKKTFLLPFNQSYEFQMYFEFFYIIYIVCIILLKEF